jgi:hypothetical protein
MADNVSISIIQEDAINSLAASSASISAQLDIAPPVMPDFNNAAYQQAMRLKALAVWLKTVNEALIQEPSPVIEGRDNDTETQSKQSRRHR